jgi:hypothetical protein
MKDIKKSYFFKVCLHLALISDLGESKRLKRSEIPPSTHLNQNKLDQNPSFKPLKDNSNQHT